MAPRSTKAVRKSVNILSNFLNSLILKVSNFSFKFSVEVTYVGLTLHRSLLQETSNTGPIQGHFVVKYYDGHQS